MNNQTPRLENMAFAGTRGISQNNAASGFKPAFLNKRSGGVEIARFASGSPAPMHLIDWFPKEWAASLSKGGSIQSLIPGIISGFSPDDFF